MQCWPVSIIQSDRRLWRIVSYVASATALRYSDMVLKSSLTRETTKNVDVRFEAA